MGFYLHIDLNAFFVRCEEIENPSKKLYGSFCIVKLSMVFVKTTKENPYFIV